MSDNCPSSRNHRGTDALPGKTDDEDDAYFGSLDDDGVDIDDDLRLAYDHMYASSNECVNGVEPTDDTGCHADSEESEVKFLKEWLVIHLDLIQQQNDEILSKDKTIFVLKQENEKLRERLLYIERDIAVEGTKVINNHSVESDEIVESTENDMTQDLATLEEIDKTVDSIESIRSNFDNGDEKSLNAALSNFIKEEASLDQSEVINHLNKNPSKSPDHMNHIDSLSKYEGSYTVHNSIENDSMKNLKMSIRRKRLCSNSSAFSNPNDSDEKKNYRRTRKRRKSTSNQSFDPEHILVCDEQYVTHAGETVYNVAEAAAAGPTAGPAAVNLEVPRWRIKSYTSCYTMEGTENLDDDAFNKRHARLEHDERRRKRWDVQRIREQRIVEKLKQRQEKVGAGARGDDSEPLETLLPTPDDVKFVEVCDTLPVSAFGTLVNKFQYSEFSLPWLNNPNSAASRRSMSKRQRAKRRGNSKR